VLGPLTEACLEVKAWSSDSSVCKVWHKLLLLVLAPWPTPSNVQAEVKWGVCAWRGGGGRRDVFTGTIACPLPRPPLSRLLSPSPPLPFCLHARLLPIVGHLYTYIQQADRVYACECVLSPIRTIFLRNTPFKKSG
jgi:hypothetical protein